MRLLSNRSLLKSFKDFQCVPEGAKPIRMSANKPYHIFSNYYPPDLTSFRYFIWMGLTPTTWSQGFNSEEVALKTWSAALGTSNSVGPREIQESVQKVLRCI